MIRLPVTVTVPQQADLGVEVAEVMDGWFVFTSDDPQPCEGFGSPEHVGGELTADYLVTIDDMGCNIYTCLPCTAASLRDGAIQAIGPRVPST